MHLQRGYTVKQPFGEGPRQFDNCKKIPTMGALREEIGSGWGYLANDG